MKSMDDPLLEGMQLKEYGSIFLYSGTKFFIFSPDQLCGHTLANHFHIFLDCLSVAPFWIEMHKVLDLFHIIALRNLRGS